MIFGSGWLGAVLAIGLAGAPSLRAPLPDPRSPASLPATSSPPARIGGVGRLRVLIRHILPNIGEPLIVNATIGAGGALLAFAGLSFIGLGVQPPDYDWGRLMMEGLLGIYVNPLAALAPGMAVVIAGLSFNLVGEAAARSLGIQVGGFTAKIRKAASKPVAAPAAVAAAAAPTTTMSYSTVRDLRVTFPGPAGDVRPVRGVSFTVRRGEAVGIVGESGSGKSVTALSIAQLVESPGVVEAEALTFLGEDLVHGDTARPPQAARHVAGHGLPGPHDELQPHQAHGRAARRGRHRAPGHVAQGRRSRAPSIASTPCGSPIPHSARSSTPTSSPAACASAR